MANLTYRESKFGYFKFNNEFYPGGSSYSEDGPQYNHYYSAEIRWKGSVSNGDKLKVTLEYIPFHQFPASQISDAFEIDPPLPIQTKTLLEKTHNSAGGDWEKINVWQPLNITMETYDSEFAKLESTSYLIAWRLRLDFEGKAGLESRYFPSGFNKDTQLLNTHFYHIPSYTYLSISRNQSNLDNYDLAGFIDTEYGQNVWVQTPKIELLQIQNKRFYTVDNSMILQIGYIGPFEHKEYIPDYIEQITHDGKSYERYHFTLKEPRLYRHIQLHRQANEVSNYTYSNGEFIFYGIPQNNNEFISTWSYWPGGSVKNPTYNIFSPSSDKFQLNNSFGRTISEYNLQKVDDNYKIELGLEYNNDIKWINAYNTWAYNQVLTSEWQYNLFNFDKDALQFPSWNGTYTIKTWIRLTNDFNEVFTIDNNLPITFNFNKTPELPTITSIDWSTSSDTGWSSLDSNIKAVEGIYLKLNTQLKLYNQNNPTTELWVDRGTGTTLLQTYNTYDTALSYATSSNAAVTTVGLVYGPIKQISTSDTRFWTTKVKNNTGIQVTSASKPMQVARLIPPTISLNDVKVNGNTYTIDYSKLDMGGADAIALYLIDENHTDQLQFDTTVATSILPFTTDVTSSIWENVINFSFRIKAVSSVTSNVAMEISKIITSDQAIQFVRGAPTVVYYPNQLGINTEVVDSDAILDIRSYKDKDKVYIRGINTNDYFEFNTSTGAIIWHTGGSEYNFLSSSK